MKVNVDFNITILDGPEAGKSFKNSYIDETRPRPGFNGLLIEELIMKWSYMPPYQRMDDCKYEEYAFNTEPCFSCSTIGNYKAWKPKEDQND